MVNQFKQVPKDTCLQCGETKEAIAKSGWLCVTISGYEQPEVDREWEQHQWDDWTDDQLRECGIAEGYFEANRRTDIFELQFASAEIVCEKEGHAKPVPGLHESTICPRCYGHLDA